MQLRDTIELWGQTGPSPGEDPKGNEIPPPVGILATCAAHVYYSTAGVNFSGDYGRFIAEEKLRAVIKDPGVEINSQTGWVIWRGEEFQVDGVLDRSARGVTHHWTLELSGKT